MKSILILRICCVLVLLCGFAYAQEETIINNAVIEGVQLTTDKGEKPDEIVVSCYFIFMDKPSNFFYDSRPKTKQIIFEFNDTKLGTSPITSIEQAPIRGFKVEQKKVDVNKTMRDLTPEWHDMVQVTFDLDAMPMLNVSEQFGVVSFNYKWTTDVNKVAEYMQVEKDESGPIIWTSVGVGAALGIGGIVWWVLQPQPEGPKDIELDLPKHPDAQ